MEESRVFLAYLIRICIEDIVGKQNISYLIIADIFAHILGEISIIDYMDFLKRIEQVAWKSISETILQDHDTAMIVDIGFHPGNSGVTAHEGTVGSTIAVFILIEEDAFVWFAFAYDLVVAVDFIIRIIGFVFYVLWNIIDEIFRGILQGNIMRITIHTSYVSMYHFSFIA